MRAGDGSGSEGIMFLKGLAYASMLMKSELVVSERTVGGCFETGEDGVVCGEKMKETYNTRRR